MITWYHVTLVRKRAYNETYAAKTLVMAVVDGKNPHTLIPTLVRENYASWVLAVYEPLLPPIVCHKRKTYSVVLESRGKTCCQTVKVDPGEDVVQAIHKAAFPGWHVYQFDLKKIS